MTFTKKYELFERGSRFTDDGSRFMLKTKIYLLFILALFSYVMSCQDNVDSSISNNGESAIHIKAYKTLMPKATGFDEFETYCISCHSLRYIQMQPDLPEKKWATIVEKMVKNFGAPIPDSTAKTIVAYLTEVKGVK